MELETCVDRSMYYLLKDLFSGQPFVNVEDEFPGIILSLPTVAVDFQVLEGSTKELGNKHRLQRFIFYIDIFAKTKAQRDELGFKIYHALEDSVPVYNYEEGFPPTVSPSQLGCLIPDDVGGVRLEIHRIIPELVEDLYYRATLTLTAQYSQL